MALIRCPECNAIISSDSTTICPKCGYRMSNYYQKIGQLNSELHSLQEMKKPSEPVNIGAIFLLISIPLIFIFVCLCLNAIENFQLLRLIIYGFLAFFCGFLALMGLLGLIEMKETKRQYEHDLQSYNNREKRIQALKTELHSWTNKTKL